MSTTALLLPSASGRRYALRPAHYVLPCLLIALIVYFSIEVPTFYQTGNLLDILRSASISMVMFLGVTWIMATGLTDLSFMEVAAFSGMLAAFLISRHASVPVTIMLTLLTALSIGALNGLLVGVLGFPTLITTVAIAGLCRSGGIILGQGQPIYLHNTGLLRIVWNTLILGVPVVIPFAFLLYAVAWYLQERLVFGHYIFAMEQNRAALIEAGVSCRKIGFVLFVLTGILAGLSGLFLTASLNSGQPMIGNSFFLDGLTAVLLGAMMVRPGQPNVIGTLFGVIILATLVNGLSLLGWPTYAHEIIKGVLLLIGVSVAIFEKHRSGPQRS